MIETKGQLIKYLVEHRSDDNLNLEFFFDIGEGSYTLGISGIEQVFDKVIDENITFLRIHLKEI